MNITRQDIDALNAVVTVAITKEDYSEKVTNVLNDYRKKANVPGFRKGQVPMGLIKKQYGKSVLVDEVNKLIQESLNGYLTEQKLDILGNPLPKAQENLDWDADDFTFEFELGLAPSFDIDLSKTKDITKYTIIADDKMLDDQVANVRKQYGTLSSQDAVTAESEITGTFVNEEKGINNKATFTLDKVSSEAIFLGAKPADTLTLETKDLFKDAHDLETFLKVSHQDAHDLDTTVTFTVEEANQRELAALDQELFDKLFPAGEVSSEADLKAKIKEDAEKQFEQQADQKLLNDVTAYLVDNTSFDLPADFLTKWIQVSGEKQLTKEEAVAEYAKSEKGLRYQLIESKIIQSNDLQVSFEDLKDFARGFIKTQMAQFGQTNPSDQDVDNIVTRVLSNQEEVKRLSEQLMSQKLISLYKEKVNVTPKELSYDAFIKEAYANNA